MRGRVAVIVVVACIITAAASNLNATIAPTDTLCEDLQAAVTGFSGVGPATVYLEAGNYSSDCTSQVRLITAAGWTVSVVGAGKADTYISMAYGTQFVGDTVASDPSGEYLIEGMTIIGGAFVVWIDSVDAPLNVRDVAFVNSTDYPVIYSAADSVVIHGCDFMHIRPVNEVLSVVGASLVVSRTTFADIYIASGATVVVDSPATFSHVSAVDVAYTDQPFLFVGDGGGAVPVVFDAFTLRLPTGEPSFALLFFVDATDVTFHNSTIADVYSPATSTTLMFGDVGSLTLNDSRVLNWTTPNANDFMLSFGNGPMPFVLSHFTLHQWMSGFGVVDQLVTSSQPAHGAVVSHSIFDDVTPPSETLLSFGSVPLNVTDCVFTDVHSALDGILRVNSQQVNILRTVFTNSKFTFAVVVGSSVLEPEVNRFIVADCVFANLTISTFSVIRHLNDAELVLLNAVVNKVHGAPLLSTNSLATTTAYNVSVTDSTPAGDYVFFMAWSGIFHNSTFVGNGVSSGSGAGLITAGADLTVSGTVFDNNIGWGSFVIVGGLTLLDSDFVNSEIDDLGIWSAEDIVVTNVVCAGISTINGPNCLYSDSGSIHFSGENFLGNHSSDHTVATAAFEISLSGHTLFYGMHSGIEAQTVSTRPPRTGDYVAEFVGLFHVAIRSFAASNITHCYFDEIGYSIINSPSLAVRHCDFGNIQGFLYANPTGDLVVSDVRIDYTVLSPFSSFSGKVYLERVYIETLSSDLSSQMGEATDLFIAEARNYVFSSATPVALTNATVIKGDRYGFMAFGSALTVVNSTFVDFADEAITSFGVSTVLVSGSVIERCGGSGIAVEGALTVINSVISDSTAAAEGGAIAHSNGALVVNNTVFTNNNGPVGGAISASGSSASINDCRFESNSAITSGGAIDCHGDSTCCVTGCSFEDNDGGAGGAIFAQFATMSVNDSVIQDNTGSVAGSAVCCFTETTCSFDNALIADNFGAAAVEVLIGGVVTMNNSLVTRHSVGLSAFAAGSVNLNRVAITQCTGRALDASGTPMFADRLVVRDNSGSETIYVSGSNGDVSFNRSFVAGNAGSGIGCDTSTFTVFDSIVCSNGVPVDCDASCVIGGDGSGSCNLNQTDCDAKCAAEDYCVPQTGWYAGPYSGCFECGGACAAGAYSCGVNAVCVDVPASEGAYGCACVTGYDGDGTVGCSDIDECSAAYTNSTGEPACPAHSTCSNTIGSFTCTCNAGYEESGGTCVDVDECGASNTTCSVGAICVNTDGSYNCECGNNQYSSGGSCLPCPANSVAAAGTATNASDCTCNANFFRLNAPTNYDCIRCPAGYQRFLAPSACVPCAKGTYSTVEDSLTCASCPPGMTTVGAGASSAADCVCPFGAVEASSGLSCEPACVPGTYIVGGGCAECPVGSYSNTTNAESCTACPDNSVTAASGMADLVNCTCRDSFYRFTPGDPASKCVRWCGAGSYRPADDECALCGAGFYSTAANSLECTRCPAGSTSATNSTRLTNCRCPRGTYSETREFGTECAVCPDGAKCRGGRSAPEALPNYYPVGDGEFAECTPAAACAGGGECSDGYTGDLCAGCDTGYYRLDGLCRPCSNAPGLILSLFFLGLLGFCGLLTWVSTQERALNRFTAVVIGVNSLQIIAMYGRLELEWPAVAQKFFDALSVFNFNIELFAPECASPGVSAFWLRWTLTMFLPVMAGVCFALIYAIIMALAKSGAVTALNGVTAEFMGWAVGRAFFQLLSFFYLPLSAAVFEYFDCVRDATGTSVIAASRETPCYNSTYWSFAVVAIFGLLVYPVGVPAGAALALWRGKRSMADLRFRLKFGFLVGRYNDEHYPYELAVMARKLVVALVFSFVFNNAFVKAGFGLVALLASYSIGLSLSPYCHRLYNELEAVCLACAMMVLLFTVTFQAIDVVPGARDAGIVTALCFNLVAIAVGVGLDVWRQVAEDSEARADGSGMFASSNGSNLGTDAEFNDVKGTQMEFVRGSVSDRRETTDTVAVDLSTVADGDIYNGGDGGDSDDGLTVASNSTYVDTQSTYVGTFDPDASAFPSVLDTNATMVSVSDVSVGG